MKASRAPTTNAPVRKLTGVQILGTGCYVPENVVTNADLASLGCDEEWIVQRTGIRERRHLPPGEGTGDMAIAAARRALKDAGVAVDEIDLLLLATLSPDRLMPATATHVQNELSMKCGAMDISAACAGFTYALVTAIQFVNSGGSERALVIGADAMSRVIDPHDVKTYPLFGDGAGAVVVGKGSPEQGALAYTLGSDGSGIELLCRNAGALRPPSEQASAERSWFIEMDGRPVFKWAVRVVQDSANQVLEAAGVSVDQVDWWLLHQANVRILESAVDGLGIERKKVIMHLDRYGNTSAASIPIALDETVRAGKIKRGDTVLMSGFGAGLTWGTTVWRW